MKQLVEISPGSSVAIGIVVGLISTGIQSIGLTLQRKSHLLEDTKAPHDARPAHRRRRWQLGMMMFLLANIVGSSIQITTLPLPVLSTLQASGLVFNSMCATIILGEAFTRWSLGGTVLVLVGAFLIATYGSIPEPAHSLNQLLELFGQQSFVVWMGSQAIVTLLVLCLILSLSRIKQSVILPRVRLLLGLSYGFLSGLLSAHTLLLAKSAVELLVRTLVDRQNQFNCWQAYMILLSFLLLALSQLYFLHCGLKLVSTSVLYPLVFCIYNMTAILDGLIYFHQTATLATLDMFLIALGTMVLLSGVLALSWRLQDSLVQTTPCTPGMGMVEESSFLVSSDKDTLDSDTEREEAIARRLHRDEEQALSSKKSPYMKEQKGRRRITTSHSHAPLEHSEIWNELADSVEPSTPYTPLSPFSLPKSKLASGVALGRATFSPSQGHYQYAEVSSPIQSPFENGERDRVKNLRDGGREENERSPLLRRNSDSNDWFEGLEEREMQRRCGRARRRSTGFPGAVGRDSFTRSGRTKKSVGLDSYHDAAEEESNAVERDADVERENHLGMADDHHAPQDERRPSSGLQWLGRWWGREETKHRKKSDGAAEGGDAPPS